MGGGPGTPALAAAVSGAGGLGMLGAGYLAVEDLRRDVRAVRTATDGPFGVNLFVPPVRSGHATAPEVAAEVLGRLDAYREELGLPAHRAAPAAQQATAREGLADRVGAVLDEGVRVVSFVFGPPPVELVDACHRAGALVVGTATCVAEAVALAARDVDIVCAQGAEAGGHRGGFGDGADTPLVGLVALLPQVVDAVDRPVLAAGGIMDGRGIAAALALGAAGVQLGTAFLRCPEAGTSTPHRAALATARDTATVVTRAYTGRPARGIANRLSAELGDLPVPPYPVMHQLTGDIRREAAVRGLPGYLSLWSGQGAPMGRQLPAADLVARLVAETGQALDTAAAARPLWT